MGQNPLRALVAALAGVPSYLNLDAAGNLLVVQGESPTVSSTPVQSSSGNVAAAAAVATLAAAVGKTTFIAGLLLTGGGATGASVVEATVTGLLGGTMTISVPVPAGATLGIVPIAVQFNPPLPASAPDTAIVVSMASLGAGNTNAAASAWGYQK